MTIKMTSADQERIVTAIHKAELGTAGEIVCVLARASSDYAYAPLIWSSFFALATPWPLIAFTQLSAERIFIIQLLVFFVATVILSIGAVRMWLVPRRVKRARAFRAAVEQFHIRGLARTADRTGVLIFVSMAEHYARIVVDDGIAAKVAQNEWQSAVNLLVSHMREDRVAEGFVGAIDYCAPLLAKHFPPRPNNVNELPDRLWLI
ncbi:TPM domain-containing protein [Methylocella sp. CPCC 101449]|jgi:putative membrane protein|uniref:TPM domain-containing protein n=1 Tax=Methylocella sp. CPCC 101449 TaxID=2987531 RepID=UPI002892A9FD|nr:TPM domain-containing protein [Methylocella sp. CPCC 101449]HEV2573977.1 TPM domain-containing protein [Beijerinckiaceae bacterium]